MKKRIKRKMGFVLVIAMLIVMFYPGRPGKAADGFVIVDGVLTGYTGVENAVVIPDEVTTIGRDAFAGTTITSVVIGGNVTNIEAGAFRQCGELESVTIPATVQSVGSEAFQDCESLYEVTWISNAGIQDYTFDGCKSLERIHLSTNLASIGNAAFRNCESLSSFNIPAGTGTVALGAFNGCTRMQAINVEEGNSYFSAYDGCLYGGYNGSVVSLLRCPQGKQTVDIQKETTMVAPSAFFGNRMSTVEMPSEVTTISLNAFENSRVDTLVLGQKVEVFEGQTNAGFGVIKVAEGAPVAETLYNVVGEGVTIIGYNPNEPEDPVDPEEPSRPVPEKPENPTKPENPVNPEKPTDPEEPINPEDPVNPDDNNPGSSTGDGDNGSQTPDNNQGGMQIASNDDSINTASITSQVQTSAAASTTSTEHVKDNTPSTGPELNAKYILCLGVMFLGIYMILTSKKESCRTA